MNDVVVLSQTQRIIVNPAGGSVSVINAGPMGPTGISTVPGPTGPQGIQGIQGVPGFVPSAIIERATTPAGTTDEIRWSTLHKAFMIWSGTQWLFAGGPPTYFDSYEFGEDLANLANVGPFTIVLGGTGTFNAVAGVSPHYTVVTHGNGATANSASMIRSAAVTFIPGGAAGLRYRAVMSFKLALTTVVSRVGFHDATAAAAPVDGAWLEVVNGVASFKTSQASTVTTNATTLALVADRWYTIHIWFTTATACRCIMIRDDGTIDLDVTNSTNVPSAAQFFAASIFAYNTAAGAAVAHTLDWLGMGFQPV